MAEENSLKVQLVCFPSYWCYFSCFFPVDHDVDRDLFRLHGSFAVLGVHHVHACFKRFNALQPRSLRSLVLSTHCLFLA